MSVSELPEQWREDQGTYPDHIGGQIAAAAVRCCADELDRVLDGRDRGPSGIATGMTDGAQPFDVMVAMSKLLTLDGEDTPEAVKKRARSIAAAFCRVRGVQYRLTDRGEGLIDALAAAGLLAGGAASS